MSAGNSVGSVAKGAAIVHDRREGSRRIDLLRIFTVTLTRHSARAPARNTHSL
jgi:hypothetical protein